MSRTGLPKMCSCVQAHALLQYTSDSQKAAPMRAAQEVAIESIFFDCPRPAQLGLGAKVVPHKAALNRVPPP
jgi:hypothetical protein